MVSDSRTVNDHGLLLGVGRMLWQVDGLHKAEFRELEKNPYFSSVSASLDTNWAVLLRHVGGLGWVVFG